MQLMFQRTKGYNCPESVMLVGDKAFREVRLAVVWVIELMIALLSEPRWQGRL